MEEIKRYFSYFQQENETRENLKSFIENNRENLFNRSNMNGHITASGMVIHDGRVLQIDHPYIKHWLFPGGHVEKGEVPLEAAQREVFEETGCQTSLSSWHKTHSFPMDISIYEVETNVKKNEGRHFHFDFLYIFELEKVETLAISGELEKRWVPMSRLAGNYFIDKLREISSDGRIGE